MNMLILNLELCVYLGFFFGTGVSFGAYFLYPSVVPFWLPMLLFAALVSYIRWLEPRTRKLKELYPYDEAKAAEQAGAFYSALVALMAGMGLFIMVVIAAFLTKSAISYIIITLALLMLSAGLIAWQRHVQEYVFSESIYQPGKAPYNEKKHARSLALSTSVTMFLLACLFVAALKMWLMPVLAG
jgi:hypothetical protein